MVKVINSHQSVDRQRLKAIKLPGMWGVYLNSFLRGMGMYLIGFFLPIYIYQLSNSLADLLIFYATYHLFVVLSGFFSTSIIRKIGVDWSSFIGAILRICFFLFLIMIPQNRAFLYLSGIFYGLTINFCWIPFHYTAISLDDGDKKYGKEVSRISVVEKITLVIGPIIGAFIIKTAGFSNLFLIGSVFVFFSGIVFFFDDFVKKGMDFSTSRILKDLFGKERRRIWVSLTGVALENFISSMFWPLFIYLYVGSILKTGFIQGLSLAVSMLLLLLVGKRIDKKGYGVIRFGLIALVLNWVLRIFISSGTGIFASNIFYELGGILLWLPFSAWIYSRISKERKTEFLLEREIVLHFVGFFLCLFLLLFRNYFSWFLIFCLAIVGLFFMAGGIYLEKRK